jgi:hypothetical protein
MSEFSLRGDLQKDLQTIRYLIGSELIRTIFEIQLQPYPNNNKFHQNRFWKRPQTVIEYPHKL